MRALSRARLIAELDRLETAADRRQFLSNLICFAACIEGLFFFAAFAYVYVLRSRGLLHGLAGVTNWVFRDESAHMAFTFEVIEQVRREEPPRARALSPCPVPARPSPGPETQTC